MSFVVLLLLLGSSAMLLFLLSYTGLSKYSMLGCTRLISQFVAYELALTSLFVLLLWSYTDLCLANYSLFLQDFCTSYFTTTFTAHSSYGIQQCERSEHGAAALLPACLWQAGCSLSSLNAACLHACMQAVLFPAAAKLLYSSAAVNIFNKCMLKYMLLLASLVLFNYAWFVFALVCALAELNRVPFDLPESESELVAGFVTEYSSIYFSLVLLTEYSNILAILLLIVALFSLALSLALVLLAIVCVVRSTLNRLKFDELMTSC